MIKRIVKENILLKEDNKSYQENLKTVIYSIYKFIKQMKRYPKNFWSMVLAWVHDTKKTYRSFHEKYVSTHFFYLILKFSL